jgi:hypothetical protein
LLTALSAFMTLNLGALAPALGPGGRWWRLSALGGREDRQNSRSMTAQDVLRQLDGALKLVQLGEEAPVEAGLALADGSEQQERCPAPCPRTGH